MDNPQGLLRTLEYPGRLIVIGAPHGNGHAVILYAITGRSPSSQARKLVFRDGGIWVRPTDEETLKQGNVDLLVYPAVLFGPAGLAVSNGKQTSDIRDGLAPGADPVSVLSRALSAWDFEPDAPIFTPRISGETLRHYFETVLRPGEGGLVSTYEGPNAEPLPAFRGEPRPIRLAGSTAAEAAEAAYADLAPAPGGKDFRVAVACVFAPLSEPDKAEVRIINRHERI
jgi:IMP cyclohydrolase